LFGKHFPRHAALQALGAHEPSDVAQQRGVLASVIPGGHHAASADPITILVSSLLGHSPFQPFVIMDTGRGAWAE
jgi:hypothetical protein